MRQKREYVKHNKRKVGNRKRKTENGTQKIRN